MLKNVLQKNILTWVAILICLVIVGGCSSSSSGKESNTNGGKWEGETLKVQVLGDYSMKDTTDPVTGEKKEGMHVLKEEFEKQYSGATVEYIIIPWDGNVEKTQAMFTSNEADVYQTPGIPPFASQGFLEPLQKFIDEDDEFSTDVFFDAQPEAWFGYGPEDEEPEMYGLPYQGDARVITYDKQIFDEWDVEYLSEYPTMDEIKEKAEKMTGTNPKTGEENYGVFFQGNDQSAYTLVNLAEGQNGSWGEGLKWDEAEFNFNMPEMVKGLEWLNDMKKFAPKGITADQGDEKWLTEDNNIAIRLNQAPGGFVKETYAGGLEDRIGVSQVFKNDEGYGGMLGGSPLSIAESSENKELAWEYLKFGASEFTQEFLYKNVGIPPVIKSAVEWESIEEKEELMLPIMEAEKSGYAPRYPWDAAQPRFILASEIEATLSGEKSIEEALDQAQKESEKWAAGQ